ncbi:pyrroloquinoline quinone biosynthesis protein PqqB [Kribbella deserti]|uniref:Coenzyme PQQ synthesis protein B n=1 Tax=Kribbella deserti TaxID=1926257 RepID=A0ABV6QIT8_9ACTN
MKVVILGTAAGGGFPQWNCNCGRCASCRTAAAGVVPRTQDGLAISADGSDWYLVNASPDIRAQILATNLLAPGPGPRESPIRGALLTDAELDHSLGLLMLREGDGLEVHAPAAALDALRNDFAVREIVSRYGDWAWFSVDDGMTLGRLRVRVLAVSNKRPKYTRADAPGPWVVAFRIEDPATGGVLVYAPCLATWPEEFDAFVDGASYVLLDGTFFGPDEMSGSTRAGVGTQAQRAMGHLPIAGPDGSLVRIRKLCAVQPGTGWAYVHLNNTNPVLDATSPEYAEVRAAGVELPLDGTVLDL